MSRTAAIVRRYRRVDGSLATYTYAAATTHEARCRVCGVATVRRGPRGRFPLWCDEHRPKRSALRSARP